MLPLRFRVDIREMAVKGYSVFLKVSALLAASPSDCFVSYPGHLQQRCSRCILQAWWLWAIADFFFVLFRFVCLFFCFLFFVVVFFAVDFIYDLGVIDEDIFCIWASVNLLLWRWLIDIIESAREQKLEWLQYQRLMSKNGKKYEIIK